MASSLAKPQHQCDQCARHYSTASHLRRHKATHSSVRPSVCTFCKRQFLRSDILLRHTRNCKQNDTRPLPPVKRGRKRKACDRCSQTRVACDGDSPCDICLLKGLDCSYKSLQPLHTDIPRSYPARDLADRSQQPDQQASQRIPISFLLNISDPRVQLPYDIHRVLSQQNEGASEITDLSYSHDWIDSDPFTETWSSIFNSLINTSALDTTSEASSLRYGLDESANLSQTVNRLISCLQQAPVSGAGRAELDGTKVSSFFSADNLRRFVNAFFENAYDSNPVIHKASFNVNTASPYLVLAVMLLGSTCLSLEDASAGINYHVLVECIILDGPEFQRLLYQNTTPMLSTGNIQLIQAALLIVGLQGSKPNFEVKRRIRVQRLPALISVARLFNLTRVVNDAVLDCQMADTGEYVYKETLVRIMAWIYLLDCHCVIFYHSPPQFRILEANFGLPKQNTVFDSVQSLEVKDFSSENMLEHSALTLRSVVQQLMDDKPSTINELLSQVDTLFAQFLVLSALHCVLFDLRAIGDYTSNTDALVSFERALDRWKLLWDSSDAQQEQHGMSSSGFMIHALEFWWLAKMLVKQPPGMKGNIASDSVETFHDMIKELKAAHANERTTPLSFQ